MLLEPGSEASLGLSDVDLSTRAWYLVHDVCLLLDGERVFDLSEHGPESRARPKHHFDVVVHARLSDPLTNACYISRLAFLRCCSDEGCRVSIPLQGTREVGLLRFQIRSFFCDVPRAVVEASYQSFLDVGRVV